MGIFCEINLAKPSNGAFIPGSKICGVIKYAIDEPTAFNKITVSLKGNGHLSMKEKRKNRSHMTHRNHEYYIDIDNIIHDDEKGAKVLPVGSYESPFEFTLPEKIPSTFKYLRNRPRYVIRCNIMYYIRIKFEGPGFLNFNKKYKKEITVVSGITPRLPNVPTICGEQKTLTQWFSRKKSIVNIKTTIQSCIIKPGDKVILNCEIQNDTNVVIKAVETNLIEKYTFKSKGNREYTISDEIKDTDSKTGSIQSGETKAFDIEIVVPSEKMSLDYSKMVIREYIVKIHVGLPLPHRDAVLEIPVQIGEEDNLSEKGEAPPSYWEAMSEEVKSEGEDDGGDDKDCEEIEESSEGTSKS